MARKSRERLDRSQSLLIGIPLALALMAAAYLAWQMFRTPPTPPGIVSANGRIEATEIDISAKLAGRISEILVNEGDLVRAGQVLVKMDTAVLNAQLREAEAVLAQAEVNVNTTRSQVAQRQAEKASAEAVVVQREAELVAARQRLARAIDLVEKGHVTRQRYDDDRANYESAQAAVTASKAQVSSADAALTTARSQVIRAESEVDAARASIQRIQADINDSELRSPRDGRVQFKVAQPGEVVQAGGRVLNLIDLTDVYMTFFLPTASVGRLTIGDEARIILDAAPQFVIPARISFVADVAQFTPKTVETAEERQKLMFRVRAHIDPDLLRRHLAQVKTGLPGIAYVRLNPQIAWPPDLQVRVPS